MDPGLYFDVNGSTPPDPDALAAFGEWTRSGWGNASAAHPAGRRARAAIDTARSTLAAGLGAGEDELWFTSGGTEANNWALFGAARAAAPSRRHLVVAGIEHRSVLRPAEALERDGYDVTWLPVGADGAVRAGDVARSLRDDTFLVALMLANNETGVLQPVREVARLCRERGALLHCDAVAAIGKIPVDVRDLGCDLLSLSSHKLYAPKGCGLLYLRRDALGSGSRGVRSDTAPPFPPLIHGCGQQQGMRSGTENTAGVVALAVAFERLGRGACAPERVAGLRDRLWAGLQGLDPSARRNGAGGCLPNTLSVAFPGRSGAELQRLLGERGVSVAAGASSTNGDPSHVLLAMGLAPELARATLRFSLGSFHDEASVERLLALLEEVLCASPQPQPSP